CLNLVRGVDELQNQGKSSGRIGEPIGAEVAKRTETLDTAPKGRTCNPIGPCSLEDHLVKSPVANSVVLGQEHDDPHAIFFSPHHPPPESDGGRCRPPTLHTISIMLGSSSI